MSAEFINCLSDNYPITKTAKDHTPKDQSRNIRYNSKYILSFFGNTFYI